MRPHLCALFACCCVLAVSAMAQSSPRKPGEYPFTADSLPQAGVPAGKLEGPFDVKSQAIPGTVHRYWIYIPANYSPDHPPALLVFHDGQRATNPQGALRIPQVLDNLIFKKEIPPTLGLFVTPGNTGDVYPNDLGMSNPNHRAEEYDALDDKYTRFLVDELMPLVAKSYPFTSDPERRVIGGTSSGAICAFTVAWHRPDQFHKVISMIGSFVGIGYQPATSEHPLIPGGDIYPTLIRKTPIKPLKIFLQDGSNDLNNEHGNWFLANQQMLSALEWANANADAHHTPGPRYRIEHVWGDGSHSDTHGGAILPDILRWMFSDQRVDNHAMPAG